MLELEQQETSRSLEDQRIRVGTRLRRLRRLRGLTLQEVSRGADLSPSFLSMLERGRADVSLSRFSRLASYYGIRPSELLLEDEAKGRVNLMSPTDGLVVDRGPGVTYVLLSQDRFGVQVVHAVFDPRAAFRDVLVHGGFDVCWVLQGQLVLLYGDKEYVVNEGQLVSYEASMPHAFRNDTTMPAELLGFVAPPYW